MACHITSNNSMVIVNAMESYFKTTPPDCSLFCNDDYGLLIHKEIMYQTKFMREMIQSVGMDSKIEVFCPSLTKEELEIIVDFFYNGKIFHNNEKVIYNVSKTLVDLFGFPSMKVELSDKEDTKLKIEIRKEVTKESLKSNTFQKDFPENTIKIESEVNHQEEILEDIYYQSDHKEPKLEEDSIMFQDSNLDHLNYEEETYDFKGKKRKIQPKIKCLICEKVFKSKQTLNKHIKVLHEGHLEKNDRFPKISKHFNEDD